MDHVLATSKTRRVQIKARSIFWRAQLGHDWRTEFDEDGAKIDDFPDAHPPSRMKPLSDRAPEGRANPKGIPYLYLATDKDTAMSEVRPWLGSYISLAQFRTVRELAIVDCSRNIERHVIYFEETTPEEREKAVWHDINRAFSEPVDRSDDIASYAPTQIIAELFKRDGCDGMAYRSAFGKPGYNIALFDLDAARLINCQLYEAKSLKFEFQEVWNMYFVKEEAE